MKKTDELIFHSKSLENNNDHELPFEQNIFINKLAPYKNNAKTALPSEQHLSNTSFESNNVDWKNEIQPSQKNELKNNDMTSIIRNITIIKTNSSSQEDEVTKIDNADIITDLPILQDIMSVSTTTTTPSLTETSTPYSIINKNRTIKVNSVISENNMDYGYEDSLDKTANIKHIKTHSKHQIAYFNPPVSQGFLASTGYPKFYIGESNCSWKISVPHSHKVRLTILDLNLRCKFVNNFN